MAVNLSEYVSILRLNSIVGCESIPAVAQDENFKTDGKMSAEQLANDHWSGYVFHLLKAHGIESEIITRCGVAYRAGFKRGWMLCEELLDIGEREASGEVISHRAFVEWKRFRWMRGDEEDGVYRYHYIAAFAHGWKHREER